MDKKDIIIVDDDEGIRDIFKLVLEKAGYNVTLYSDGEKLMNDDFDLPHLFMLDGHLGDGDGFELCRILKTREHTRNIPVLIISARPDIQLVSEEAGADGYIEKPFSLKSLTGILEKYLSA